eukprot:11568967-Alexandrium_andersonii.AAC.1
MYNSDLGLLRAASEQLSASPKERGPQHAWSSVTCSVRAGELWPSWARRKPLQTAPKRFSGGR